ncbi:unnamed protein product [Arabidopsis halleri]
MRMLEKSTAASRRQMDPMEKNLANGPNIGFTCVSAVNLWVAQKDYYNHTINSCISTYQCKHYTHTQVVWSNSVKIGCAC